MRLLLVMCILGIGYSVQSQDTLKTVSASITMGGPIDSVFLAINDSIANEILPRTDTLYLYNEEYIFEANTYIVSVLVDSTSVSNNSELSIFGERTMLFKVKPTKSLNDFSLLQRSGFNFKTRTPYFISFQTKEWFEKNQTVRVIDVFDCAAQIIYFKLN